ncbi:hypothetical protein AAG570_012737 [Ranatra chinensis]|uniref:Homeobox protein prospero n=1 Tax=Ranatra chinensis TaxID=642074 RepID=A0ABD0YX73_9HEMI
MMSSEEETDCYGLYGDKLLKKAKRSRQRVDAGEPRNSYSSIPNFSSRPSFLAGGLYGALFSQSHRHLGLLSQGFGPAKMLNELLGRQVKRAADAGAPADALTAVDPAASDPTLGFDRLDTGAIIGRGADDEAGPPVADVAHHMLRDILQGRKKELLALEQELRGVGAGVNADPPSPDDNDSINNNNNNNNNNNDLKGNALIDGGDASRNFSNGADNESAVNGVVETDDGSGGEGGNATEEGLDRDDSDSEPSLASPASDPAVKIIKEEPEDGNKESGHKTEQIELKRARVENIVSSMRSSPSLPTQVNGCKKRKLYHPQQHDTTAERYSGSGAGANASVFADDDTADNNSCDATEIRQKKVEKDALKTQLRTMQEQLAEMQQKYVQLCTRMDQDSECHDVDDGGSDIDRDESLSPPEKTIKNSPATTPVKEMAAASGRVTTPVGSSVSPVVSKMISAKLQPPHVNPHQMPLPPNFNGALSLLQQQVLQDQQHAAHHHSHHHHHPQMAHHALSNAAAMYFGVSHKFFVEQEARLNKEAAIAAEQHQQHVSQQQQHTNQQQQHHNQAQQGQQQGQQQALQQALQPGQQPQSQSQQPSQQPQGQQHQPHQSTTHSQHNRQSPTRHQNKTPEFAERSTASRNNMMAPVSGSDLEGLADVLKTEITSTLGNIIDSIMSRFVQQKRFAGKQSEAAAELLNRDLALASQLLDRKSPRTKVVDRGNGCGDRSNGAPAPNGTNVPAPPPSINGTVFPPVAPPQHHQANNGNNNNPVRPSPNAAMFQPPKPPPGMSSAGNPGGHGNPFCSSESREGAPEQNEALSLVVAPKKKRHKVTDTRITPRTVSRILAQDGLGGVPPTGSEPSSKFGQLVASTSGGAPESPPPRPYHPPPPPMLPVSLPTSVAIPNPSLHESQVFSPYSPFYHQGHPHVPAGSPPGVADLRDSPPLPHPPTLLHPALLAAAQHAASPDYTNIRINSALTPANDNVDRGSDCNSGDGPYDGITPTISTLTPMHLRKAKLMFFWVRYPSSAVLKMYFPDIKFNKNNTAQLVKWFSNFREFYYIQMEKYARQAVSEGVKTADDLHVSGDCEIYRVLNLHYNRNNHIEVPQNFRYVVEQTLREFFKAIQGGKDTEQSWKKCIYKIISRLDDPVPEYFKSPNFLEQLE